LLINEHGSSFASAYLINNIKHLGGAFDNYGCVFS